MERPLCGEIAALRLRGDTRGRVNQRHARDVLASMKGYSLACAALLILTGCIASPEPSTSVQSIASPQPLPSATPARSPATGAVVATSFGGVSFVMPASWQEVRPRIWGMPAGPRLFLSNASITDPCAVSPRGEECWKPLAELPPDGILVTFTSSAGLMLPNPSPTPHEIVVGGWCEEMGGERSLESSFLPFAFSACLRGPEFATNEALFAQVLSSMQRP